MSTTPSSTATALAQMRQLLAGIDHEARKRLDAEARLALVTDVVAIARQVEALRAVLVGEADRAKAAETARGTSIKSLLAVSSKVTPGEAAAWVYGGQDINARRAVRDATLNGDVSVAQARAIDGVLGELPATLTDQQRHRAEASLLDKAHLMDAKDLAKQTRAVLEEVAPEVDAVEDELARLDTQRKQAWAARSLTLLPDGRGSIRIQGQLPLLEGEAFKKLVEAHTQSNRRALEQAVDRHDEGLRTFAQRTADGLIALVNAHIDVTSSEADAPGSRPRTKPRSTVVVTMNLEALQARAEQAGVLPDGQTLTAGELRRLLCDSQLIPAVLGGASEPHDVGRARRLVTPEIRRALELRDQGCVFPGCAVPARACEAHHILPWWAGGPTSLENLVLLCPHHHGTVEPLRFWPGASPPTRWQVRMGDDGHPEFFPPGRPGQPQPPPIRHQRITERIARRAG